MLLLGFLLDSVGSLLEISLSSTLRTVLGLSGFIKGVLLSLELGFLILVVVLGLGVSFVLLLDHAFKRLSFASQDVQLLLNVIGLL
jgi:hypothetical protein